MASTQQPVLLPGPPPTSPQPPNPSHHQWQTLWALSEVLLQRRMLLDSVLDSKRKTNDQKLAEAGQDAEVTAQQGNTERMSPLTPPTSPPPTKLAHSFDGRSTARPEAEGNSPASSEGGGNTQARGGLSDAEPRFPATRTPAVPLRPLRPLPGGTTTLVVRNIPAHYNPERLLREWPPDGTYNFLYLPYDSTERRPKGYASLNFVMPAYALAFQRQWHGNHLSHTSRSKHLDIVAAATQGIEGNLKQLESKDITKVVKRGHLPVLFEGNRQMEAEEVLCRLESVLSASDSVEPCNLVCLSL
mmetsp:Transcript_142771/g.397693  ORF Transcript_142771/g.397693 Transcript_142771/m.397693 type:complete len:301 (+) Transcript_142771:89-991(+)